MSVNAVGGGAAPPVAQQNAAEAATLRLNWGDTLGQIAQDFGTSVDTLMSLNPQINNPDVIYAGDTIRVPPGPDGSPGSGPDQPSGPTQGPGQPQAPQQGPQQGPQQAPQQGPQQAPQTAPGGNSTAGTTPNGDRSWFMAQPGSWQCGPTSLTMALADWGVRPANSATLNEMISATGAKAGVGVPGNASLIANAARSAGMQAEFNPSNDVNDVRKALDSGKTVVLNGGLSRGGHFMYVKGTDANGNFIVGDPIRPQIKTLTPAQLQQFSYGTGAHPPGFAAIWK